MRLPSSNHGMVRGVVLGIPRRQHQVVGLVGEVPVDRAIRAPAAVKGMIMEGHILVLDSAAQDGDKMILKRRVENENSVCCKYLSIKKG